MKNKYSYPQIVEKYLYDLSQDKDWGERWLERNGLGNKNTKYGFISLRGADKTIREMMTANHQDQLEGKPPRWKVEQKYELKNGKMIAWVRAIKPIRYGQDIVGGEVKNRYPIYA